MNKNIKSMFFVAILLVLLVGVTSVSAIEVSDDTTSSIDTNDVIAPDIETTDNTVETTRTMEKENKNLKTATKTVEVNDFAEITSTINGAVNDAENDEYIIHLNEGTYQITSNTLYNNGSYTPDIIINANNQSLTGSTAARYLRFNNKCNVIINDADISLRLQNYVNLTLNNVSDNNTITNYDGGVLTINNSTISTSISNSGDLILSDDVIFTESTRLTGSGNIIVNNSNIIYPYIDTFNGENKFTGITLDKSITNDGQLTLTNVTLDNTINNNGVLIISDDSIITENLLINGMGEIVINDSSRITPYLTTYNNNYTLTDTTLTSNKNNLGNLTFINCVINAPIVNNEQASITLINSTVNSTITNKGVVNVDENTIFDENGSITGLGPITTDDISRIMPYISSINGNFTLSDLTINKSYNFIGNNTINNCNITSTDNVNYGILIINNSNVNVDESDSFIDNLGVIIITDNTMTDKINGPGSVFENTIPDDYVYDTHIHIITNDTVDYFFDLTGEFGLNELVNHGDILDVQGEINIYNRSLTINKAVTMYSSTHDANISLNTIGGDLSGANPGAKFMINNGGSYSNISDLYLFNTQFYITNTHYVYLNNMSMIVDSVRVGSGLGQTAIRDNSSHVVLNNSLVYTKNNGGSSSFVFTYASYCTVENTVVQAVGNVGNIVYLNVYNPTITTEEGNCYNTVRNMTLIGPETPSGICWGIAVTGHDNLFENNKIYYGGSGITTGMGAPASNNTFIGNEFYNGCGFNAVANSTVINNTAYDNGLITIGANSTAYNNTASRMTVSGANSYVSGGNITTVTVSGANATIEDMTIESISVTGANAKINNNNLLSGTMNANNAQLTNNNITSININRALNITDNNIESITINSAYTNLTNNNITSTVNLGFMYITLKNNNITSNDTYAVTGTKTGNTITDNYLRTPETYGDGAVQLDPETNTIANNTPKIELKIDTTEFTQGQTASITASICLEDEKLTDINKGKVTFKVNGKTLKDANGKVIYTKLVNGTATIENYTIPNLWEDGMKIEAVYSGSTQCEKLNTEETITITSPEPTLTITPITDDVQPESTITIKAKVAAGDNAITNGKIIFKLNGKTLKDTNGKVIYATVDSNGEVSIEYNVGNLKANTYKLEAVFTSSIYDKLTSNTTITIA